MACTPARVQILPMNRAAPKTAASKIVDTAGCAAATAEFFLDEVDVDDVGSVEEVFVAAPISKVDNATNSQQKRLFLSVIWWSS